MKKLEEKKINTILVIGAFIFNILIFAPIEMYFVNRSEFWFSLKSFLPIIVLISTVVYLVSLLLLLVIFKNKKTDFVLRIIFALTTALYIQGNFLNFGYKQLDGSDINWNQMINKGLINTAIWLIILFFPYFFKRLKDIKKFRKFTSYISLFIIGIELITLSTLVVTKNINTKTLGLSNKNIFNLSNESNIIVIMSDTFEGTYMNRILEQHPEYKEELKDFTYFNNCTSVSFYTYSSMPTLLTGVESVVGNNLEENMKYCMENTDLYKILKENGYTNEIYVESALRPKEKYDIDNLVKSNNNLSLNTRNSITKEMYKFVMFRYSPHFLKSNFVVSNDEFNIIENRNFLLTYREKNYFLDDVAFNTELLSSGINTNQKKSFKFYQQNGVHAPYTTTPNIEYDYSVEYSSTSELDRKMNEVQASLNLLCNYVDELKKAGVYDNTNIIFMADHGFVNRFHTVLLVKKAKENHDFTISAAPVSLLEDLKPTILNMATNSKNYGKDFFDYQEGEIRTRKVQDYTYKVSAMGDERKLLSKLTFKTEGLASDESSFYLDNENYYTEEKELTEKYVFGSRIIIQNSDNYKSVKTEGFLMQSLNNGTPKGCNIGKNASITINADEATKDLTARFSISKVYDEKQKIVFKVNGETIYNTEVTENDKKVEFNIPKEIWNKDNEVKIELEFPDAVVGNHERTMMMAICLNSIKIEQ